MQKTPGEARIVILGISSNPERYSYKAAVRLKACGFENIVGVNPALPALLGIDCAPDLAQVAGPIDTITVYLNPAILEGMVPAIVGARPRRIILNPGAEHARLAQEAKRAGIIVEEACTLVLLATSNF